MSTIASCPICAKLVSIPFGVESHVQVRCPACRSEYELQSALDSAPPLLEVIGRATEEEADLAPAGFVSGSSLLDAPSMFEANPVEPLNDEIGFEVAVEEEEASMFDEPAVADELAQPSELEGGAEESDTELESIRGAAAFDDLLDAPVAASDLDDDDIGEFDLTETPAEVDSLESASLGDPLEDELAFDAPVTENNAFDVPFGEESPFGESLHDELPGGEAAEDGAQIGSATNEFEEAETPALAIGSGAKRRKREPSAISNLIGVVGGGVVGCAIAYMIVLWVGGPEKDVLGYGYKLPSWMVPAAFSKPKAVAVAPTPNPTPGEVKQVDQAAKDAGFAVDHLDVAPLPDEVKKPADDAAATEEPADAPADDAAAPAEPLDKADPASATEPADDPFAKPAPFEEAPGDAEPGTPFDAATEDSSPIKPADEPMEEEKPADGGDIFGDAPADAPTDAPADEPAAEETAPVAGLKSPPTHTADELTAPLAEAEKQSAAIDAASDKAVANKAKTPLYKALCRVGGMLPFVEDANTQVEATAAVLAPIAADPARFAEIGKVGGKWLSLDAAKRGDAEGVLLAGTVDQVEEQGGLQHAVVLLSGDKKPVSVYSNRPLGFKAGDSVLVLGSIVADPAEAIDGFSGDEKTVVWQGMSLKAAE